MQTFQVDPFAFQITLLVAHQEMSSKLFQNKIIYNIHKEIINCPLPIQRDIKDTVDHKIALRSITGIKFDVITAPSHPTDGGVLRRLLFFALDSRYLP